MASWNDKPPWYAAGLAFECIACGGCCAGPQEGYVWVTPDEVAAIAEFLGLPPGEVLLRHVRKACGRQTILEDRRTHDCIFLVPDGDGRRTCSIYAVRPTQCRTWPFWKTNLRSPDSWAQAGLRCPGINRGQVASCAEIEALAGITHE